MLREIQAWNPPKDLWVWHKEGGGRGWGGWAEARKEKGSSHFLFFFIVVQWPSPVWLFMTPWAIISLLFISRYYPECFHYMCLLSHVWLCDPMDCSPPGSSIHGIFLARILQWVTIPFSRGSSWTEKVRLLHLLQLTIFSTDSWLLYYWATCEVLYFHHSIFFSFTNIQLRWLLFLFHTWSKQRSGRKKIKKGLNSL